MGERTGEKLGWSLGWLGGFLWILILSMVFLVQGKRLFGLIGLLLFTVAATIVFFLAPWRYPSAPFWKLIAPLYMVFFGSIVWAFWVFEPVDGLGLSWWSVVWIMPFLLPFGLMRNRRWNDDNFD
jgi:hypothetical protein